MSAKTFFPYIHIKSTKFPVLPGEEAEMVNKGTYGKALARYLESRLKERSYDVSFICCEDWGWWVVIAGQRFTMGVCVYGSPSLSETHELCVTVSPEPCHRWSWTRFQFIDTSARVNQLFSDLREMFSTDPEIEVLGFPAAFPLG